ncbi:F0F1 ATP synthase subunit delta [Priestia aryabhattai]|uniref:F0F1 ATP synthase subunit delta n=1 Tax=Priestia aryabhattai TaxID=412384 RepID=UPI002E2484DA|nr:F0F1 ATP synthase subunit delta [Priestia aryabhattai]MED3920057.1 F0F1 ATP synthase subunit delta [Priestia aryabhattai]MED3991844.1 F0F1 ATP synthase subunit delta [Priestia aryabhattai]MED4007700.1 F0F1 ATP synthase subunit delta [Priestia aryabhattai]
MSQPAVAKRYALALFKLATEKQMIDEMQDQLQIVEEVFAKTPELMDVLTHPKITIERKKQFVSEAFAELSPTVQHTVLLLLERHRIQIVSQMVQEYRFLANEVRGVADATVYSVKPLSADEKRAISQSFASKVGKHTLNISNVVDKSLIGGVKLRIGNRIYDGSISSKLETIHRGLLAHRS